MSSVNKLCRTCLGEGTRHIFQPYVYNDQWCSVASINFIVDKLRYVLMLPISEQDGLPLWICELCLVQLNLAYNFKRRAIEREKNLPLFVGDRQQHYSGREIRNAITYDVPDSADHVNPVIKLESTSDGFDYFNNPTGISPQPSSEGSALPRIVSVVSYAAADQNEPSGGVTPPTPTPPGMVILKTNPDDPAEDAAFIHSFRHTPNLTNASNESTPIRNPLQDRATKQKKRRSRSSSLATKRKRKTKRHHPAPLNDQNTPDNINQQHPLEDVQKPVRKLPTIGQKMCTIMKSLEIDMVSKKPTRGKHSSRGISSVIETSDLPIAKKVKLRRNSVCVPSYRE